MPTEKKPYVAKVALKMRFPEARYFSEGVGLEVDTKGSGSSVPIAIARAVRLAFADPKVKRKSPAYIKLSVKVLSRWLLEDEVSAEWPTRDSGRI